AQAFVEDDLGGQSRVGATEQRRCRMLLMGQIMPAFDILIRMPRLTRDESTISVQHLLPGGCRGEYCPVASAIGLICGINESASSAVDSGERAPYSST